jgi:hypothetical protein
MTWFMLLIIIITTYSRKIQDGVQEASSNYKATLVRRWADTAADTTEGDAETRNVLNDVLQVAQQDQGGLNHK